MKVNESEGLCELDIFDPQLAYDYLSIPSQLLLGRIGLSIFLCHCYKPYLRKVRAKVLKTIQTPVTDIINRTPN